MTKTKKKSAVRTAAMIKTDNARFAKMTKVQKRVAIAKDALAAIKAKVYVAEEGTYCNVPALETLRRYGKADDAKLAEQLRDNMPQCECCAVGALFLSKARMADKVTVSDYLDTPDYWAQLEPYFKCDQLDLMEAAFEVEDISRCRNMDAAERAMKFGVRYELPRDRLVAILNNVVKNNGKFVV